jgi:carbamoyltransferase
MSRKIVLGINAAHDAAACLLINGELITAVPEERLTRSKRHEGYPYLSVQYCLETAGLGDLNNVDVIVINEYVRNDFGLDLRNSGYQGMLIVNPSHHMLHAYYAWIASAYEKPAVLVLDGDGYSYGEYQRRQSPLLGLAPDFSEMEEAESMYTVNALGEMSVVNKKWGLWEATEPYSRFPSLGHMFSVASEYIFGHMQHAGKTMGLAPYGNASTFPEPIITYTDTGLVIDTEWITRVPLRSDKPAHLDQVCCDIAAKVQEELERSIIHLCTWLHEATGATQLAFSGGVGLNSVANGLILRRTPFKELFVTPASGDSGIAIGAALYGHHAVFGERPCWNNYDNYHGRIYPRTAVMSALNSLAPFIGVDPVADAADAAARDIASGKFVGWFEGGSEFGPRALGHRSILADPRPADMRDRLNASIKFREPFRPYAASVLTERTREYFDAVSGDPFMMTVVPIHDEARDVVASVCHMDGTCRIQTVDPDHPGLYRRLIERFAELTGTPMVLNTSFNIRGEPIVETPEDALRCYLACNLDVLYLDGLRITKTVLDESVRDATEFVPCLNDSVTLGMHVPNIDGAAGSPVYFCQTRTGHRITVTELEHKVLLLIDGQRPVADYAAALALPDATATFRGLQSRGLVAIAGRQHRRPPHPEPGTLA